MSSQERGYWFAAKRYGWGWGLPSRWQGWVVLIGYLGSVLLGIYVGRKEENPQALFGYLAFITIVFVVVVVSKGEPPWRRSQRQ